MKKIWSTISATIISFTLALSATSVTAFASNDNLTSAEIIDIADDFVNVSDDGFIELELPQDIINQLTSEEYNAMMFGINSINDSIASGELETTQNGTIYAADDDELVVQGGNVNDVEVHWWGVRRYASSAAANKLALDLSKASNACWGVSAIAALIGGPYGTGVAIAGVFGAVLFGFMSSDISYQNSLTSRGIVWDLKWIGIYSVYPQ